MEAARFGEIVVVATLGAAAETALRPAGREAFAGKLVLATSTGADSASGVPLRLVVAFRLLPRVRRGLYLLI
jgi:hypothetical protein